MTILFLHGLEGSPHGVKVQALREFYAQSGDSRFESLRVPDQRQCTPLERLQIIRHAYTECPETPWVIGSSLGGWLGAILATEVKVAGLVLLAPAFFAGPRPSLPEGYPRAEQFMAEAKSLPGRPGVTCPAHMIIASNDEVIPRRGQEQWLSENPHATSEFWDDDHRLSRNSSRIGDALVRWWGC